MNVTSTLQPDPEPLACLPKASALEVDASCRPPVLFLFAGAAFWLVIGWVFAMVASIKFHSPSFLGDVAWLTYGRVYPAFLNAWLYGFAVQAGLGVALWMLAHIGGAPLARPMMIWVGAKLWNVGVAIGFAGVLAGAGTGFEFFEFPRLSTPFLFIGYLLMAVFGVVTFHRRRNCALYPSQWFLLAALFWFAWIYATASCLLVFDPVRGAAQVPVHLWYVNNLTGVFLTFIGLGVVLYFVPKLTGKDLSSQWLVLFAFWVLLFFASWGGIHPGAPLPAWLPGMSTVATVISLVGVLALLLVYLPVRTGGAAGPALRFIRFGAIFYFVAALVAAVTSLKGVSAVTEFTLMRFAQVHIELYAFVSMVLFGAIYYITPRLTLCEWPRPAWVGAHFWCAAVGGVLLILSLAAGGVVQGGKLNDPSVPFADIMRGTLMPVRMATLAELVILIGHLAFLGNLFLLLSRCFRSCCIPVIRECIAETQTAEVKR